MIKTYGLRRKGTTDIIGVIPLKVHQHPPTLKKYLAEYEEIPLYTGDEVQKLQDEIDRLRDDAARYKWLKNQCVRYSEETDSFELRLRYGGVIDEGLNSAIDRRMAKNKDNS